MTPVAADLTDDDIRSLGAYFASFPGPPGPTEADPDPDLPHGRRRGRGNVIMPEVAYSLDEDDIKSIAHFMSREGADAKPLPFGRRPASRHGLVERGGKCLTGACGNSNSRNRPRRPRATSRAGD